MNKVRKQMNKAKRAGLSNVDLAMIRENARKTAQEATKEMEQRATEKAFLYMLAIPLNVLVNDYWEKSAKKRIPKFIEDCMSLYEAVQNGNVSDEELADLLYEYSGVKIEAEWMKGGE